MQDVLKCSHELNGMELSRNASDGMEWKFSRNATDGMGVFREFLVPQCSSMFFAGFDTFGYQVDNKSIQADLVKS
jgi:hypothetical protein